MLGDGKGGFARGPGSPFAVGKSPYPLAVGDLNGDAAPDIAVPNSGPGNRTVTVLLNDGKGAFHRAPKSPFEVAEAPFFVAIGDVNGDRKLDLVTTHDDRNQVSILLGDGRGNFQPAPGSPYRAGKGAWRLAVADFNGDDRLDIATSNLESDSVTVLLGK